MAGVGWSDFCILVSIEILLKASQTRNLTHEHQLFSICCMDLQERKGFSERSQEAQVSPGLCVYDLYLHI